METGILSQPVIAVEHLGKRYRAWRGVVDRDLPGALDPGTRLAAGHFAREWSRKLARGLRHDVVWALKDVSFEVNRGDAIGIIGQNGSGKSTLLKILSRITEPTEGEGRIYGRVGSLLEVGTGFHPELTGRENVHLNGAILGMRKPEITRKFDAIVSFAGVGRYIDMPVKFYSSGMSVRLAFAVAAHLEPDILIVDEVLAVGDADFQSRCLKKMEDMTQSGRTVLFVSHNLSAVSSLCRTAILLKAGRIVTRGPTDSVIDTYLEDIRQLSDAPLAERADRTGSGAFRFSRITVAGDATSSSPVAGQPASFTVDYQTTGDVRLSRPSIDLIIWDRWGKAQLTLSTRFSRLAPECLSRSGRLVCRVPRLTLAPGTYQINARCKVDGETLDHVVAAAAFDLADSDFYGTGMMPVARKHGSLLCPHDWSALDDI